MINQLVALIEGAAVAALCIGVFSLLVSAGPQLLREQFRFKPKQVPTRYRVQHHRPEPAPERQYAPARREVRRLDKAA